MIERPAGTATPECRLAWNRILDLLGGLALAFQLVAVAVAVTEGAGSAVLAVVTTLAASAVWLGLRRTRSPAAAYALAVLAVACAAVASSPFPILVVLVAVLLLGYVVGAAAALGASAVIVALEAGVIILGFHSTAVDALVQGAGLAALLLMATGFGTLFRSLEKARAEAVHRGAELEAANQKLRAAIVTERELVLARERARSARELHDGLGHRLTLLGMSLRYAERTREQDPDGAWAEVANAAATAQDALGLTRLWARALNPPHPTPGVGGTEAFDSIAESFRGTGLDVSVAHHGTQQSLPADAAVFAARLVQEGMTNVLRHAEATRVEIEVVQSPHSVRISLSDDGHGTDAPHEGFGLRSLRERADSLGGSLTSGPGHAGGWQLIAVLPLDVAQPVGNEG